MGNIIIPGEYGYGTQGFVPTDAGYQSAADQLVRMHDNGQHINEYDPEVRRVLDYCGVSSLESLKIKRRGW